jgi:HAD superfamily phosphoserine phosphatase-like hydrolase
MLKLVGFYALHKAGLFSLSQVHNKIFDTLFRDSDVFSIKKYLEPFLEQEFQRLIYPPAYQELVKAKAKGYYTLILSSSPDFLVEQFARRFGVHEWQASLYLIDNQEKFCRISHLVEGETKAEYMRSIMSKMNVSRENTVAYSDSYLDLPFLKMAGEAVAVNPDRILRKICKKEKWMII